MKKFYLLICLIGFGLSSYAQQILGDFSTAENFEWPRVLWSSAPALNWDEGLINLEEMNERQSQKILKQDCAIAGLKKIISKNK